MRLCKRIRKDTTGSSRKPSRHEHEAERAVGDNGAKEKLMSGVSDEIRRRFLKEVLVLEDKISKVDNELHEQVKK